MLLPHVSILEENAVESRPGGPHASVSVVLTPRSFGLAMTCHMARHVSREVAGLHVAIMAGEGQGMQPFRPGLLAPNKGTTSGVCKTRAQ